MLVATLVGAILTLFAFNDQSICSLQPLHPPSACRCTCSVAAEAEALTQQPKQLSARLSKVCDLCFSAAASFDSLQNTPAPFTVADIGCDHAQLAIGLLQNNVADNVIAVDRMQAPLNRGRANARAAGLESSINFRCGDGLEPLRPNDGIKVICIAGVGARCMINILEPSGSSSCGDRLRYLGVEHIVLQPVSPHIQYIVPLRRWFDQNGWAIQDERIIKKRKRFYLNIWATDSNILSRRVASSSKEEINQSHTMKLTPKLSDEELVLGSQIRSRVYSFLQGSENCGSHDGSTEEIAAEARTWKHYVTAYEKWASSAMRSDTYDRDAGIPRAKIASILAQPKNKACLIYRDKSSS